MKACILGTCRTCDIKTRFICKINPYVNAGDQSKIYKYKDIMIHTQPITYTTKLSDVRDILKYLKGNVENNIDPNYPTDPNHNINFFKTFFRGCNIRGFVEKIIKKPGEPIDGINNDYDFYIFEVCSLRQIKFKNANYGKEFEGKNLLWNIDIYNHNTIKFQKEDFEIIHNDINIIKETFKEIVQLTNNKPILIVGPYLLKNTKNNQIDHEVDRPPTDYVNNHRKEIQDILKEMINMYSHIDYFDMTEYVKTKNILFDEYHFNDEGTIILSNKILEWINSKLS